MSSHPKSPRHGIHRCAATALFAAWAVILLPGCAAFHPVQGIPARYLPEEYRGVSRANKRTIDLSLLKRTVPPAHLVDTGDVLGIYIEGVLGDRKLPQPVNIPLTNEAPPSFGFPIPVRDDGTISLPLVGSIDVRGLTIGDVESKLKEAYTKNKQYLNPENERILVSLQRARTYRVLVIRQEGGANLNSAAGGMLDAGTLKRGTGQLVSLPAYRNDVLHALTQTGGMPGLDAENAIYVIRRRKSINGWTPLRGTHLPTTTSPEPLPAESSSPEPNPAETPIPAAEKTPRAARRTLKTLVIRAQSPNDAWPPQGYSAPNINSRTNYRRGGAMLIPTEAMPRYQGDALYREQSSQGVIPVDYSSAEFASPQSGQYWPQGNYDPAQPPPGFEAQYAPVKTDALRYQPQYDERVTPASSQNWQPPPSDPRFPPSPQPNWQPPSAPPSNWGPPPGSPAQITQPIYDSERMPPQRSAPPMNEHNAYPPQWQGGPQQPEFADSAADPLPTMTPAEFGWELTDGGLDGRRIIKIPVRLGAGETVDLQEQDVILEDGDIVFIESRDTEVFYTGGLLASGQYPIPRDYDLNILQAIAIAQARTGGGSGSSRATTSVGGQSALNNDVSISASSAIVLRYLPDGRMVPIEVDLYQARTDVAEQVIIQPGDYILLQYRKGEAIMAFIERHLLEGALFGVAAAQLNSTGN